MNYFFSLFAVLIFITVPLALSTAQAQDQAQDNVIKIIKDDGSVVVFDMGKTAPQPPPPPKAAPEVSASSPSVPSAGLDAPDPTISESVVSEPEPPVAQDPYAPRKINSFLPPKTVKSEVKKPVAKKAPVKTVRKSGVPLPLRKPLPPAHMRAAVHQPAPSLEEGPAPFLTKDQATAIALEYAPPSRGMIVRENIRDDGTPVFVVIFKTEDGRQEMLIDGVSGTVFGR